MEGGGLPQYPLRRGGGLDYISNVMQLVVKIFSSNYLNRNALGFLNSV